MIRSEIAKDGQIGSTTSGVMCQPRSVSVSADTVAKSDEKWNTIIYA
jgi:hypothetical protein